MSGYGHYWTERMGRTTTRRAVLRGSAVAGLGLAGAALVGCGEEEAPPAATPATPGAQGTVAAPTPTPAAEQPKHGGTFRRTQRASYNDIMDPHRSVTQAGNLLANTLEHAVRVSQDGTQIEPGLLASWEVSGDLMSVVFAVQPEAKWHNKPPVDGRAVDAEDIVFNLMRITGALDPDEAQRVRYHRRSTLTGMEKAEAVDEKHVKVTFGRPTGTFLAGLADFRNIFMPRDFLEKGGTLEDTVSIVGSGAFVMDTFKDDQLVTWSRNPEYWGKDAAGNRLPYQDGVRWDWVPDLVTQQALFIKGDIDDYLSPDFVARETIRKSLPDVQQFIHPYGGYSFFLYQTQVKPFDDPRVRKALDWALDYKHMGDSDAGEGYWNYTGPCYSAFPEAIQPEELAQMSPFNPATKEQDVTEAKKLMDAAGYPTGQLGFSVWSSSTTAPPALIRAQDRWHSIWPDMTVKIDLPPDKATFDKRLTNSDFEMVSYGFGPASDPVLDLINDFHSDGARNYGKLVDPKVDDLLDQAIGLFDYEERKQALREVQLYLLNDVNAKNKYRTSLTSVFYQPWMRGLENLGRVGQGGYGWGEFDKMLWRTDA